MKKNGEGRKIKQAALIILLSFLMVLSVFQNVGFRSGMVASAYTVTDNISGTISEGEVRNITYNYSGAQPANNTLTSNEFEIDLQEDADISEWLDTVRSNYYSHVDFDYHAGKTNAVTGIVYSSETHSDVDMIAVGNGGTGSSPMFCDYTYYIVSKRARNSSLERYIGIDESNNAVLTDTKSYKWRIIGYTEADGTESYVFVSVSNPDMALTIDENNNVVLQAIASTDGVYAPSESQIFSFNKDEKQSGNDFTAIEIRGAQYRNDEESTRLNLHVTSDNCNVGEAVLYKKAHTGGHRDVWFFEYAEPYYNTDELTFPDGFVVYTWESSDPEIAEVSDTGKVRIYSDGEVTFTCTATAGLGLTARDDLDNVRTVSVTYNFTKYQLNDGNPLTDTNDKTNFPVWGEPGSVQIEKSTTDVSVYNETGVATLQLDFASVAGNEPIDVVLVIDISRSMADFWGRDVVYYKENLADIVDNNGKENAYAYYDYYIRAGYLNKSANPTKPYSEDPVIVYDENGREAYYCVYEFDTDTYYLYDLESVVDGAVVSGSDFIKEGDTIEDIAPDGFKGEDNTADDEQLKNYDKLNAARQSAATFVETLLDASPESRIALVQFADDEMNADGEYYKINSRVVSNFTSDKNELLNLIYNKGTATDNRYAQDGAGAGYHEYGNYSDEIETEMASAGMTLSNKGGTNYGLAFERAEDAVAADTGTANDRRIVIFMTDGSPNTLNLANDKGDSLFGSNNERNNSSEMKNSSGNDAPSWGYFALRRQMQAKLRLENQGFEIISVGFDLDSDGEYLGNYKENGTYTVDGSSFTTNLADDLEITGSGDALATLRKKIVESIATFDSETYFVDKNEESGEPDYGALNAEYKRIAESIMYKTKDTVVTDKLGSSYELRLLDYSANGGSYSPKIEITSKGIVADSSGTVTEVADSEEVIETVTFSGTDLAGGIDVNHTYVDGTGKIVTEKITTITSEPYTISGEYFTYDSETKIFTWNLGDVPNKHYTFEYDVYLTGSDPAYEQAMGRTDSKWQNGGNDTDFAADASLLYTNEYAKASYTNYLDNSCELTYVKPDLGWKTTEINVTKDWDDDDDSRGMRPDSISVQLIATVNGKGTEVYSAAVLDKNNNWKHKWDNLPLYSDGDPISYSVKEFAVDKYTTDSVQSGSDITITNTLITYDVTVRYEDISGNKLKDNNKPYNTLLGKGSPYDVIAQGSKLTEITKDGTTYTFYEVKDGSDAESSDSISKDVVVTYVYVECKAPKIQKKVDTELVKIVKDPSTQEYFINYSLIVTNENGYELQNVQGTDVLPEGLAFVSSEDDVTAAADNRTLTWKIDSIAAGGSEQIDFKVKITDIDVTLPYKNIASITHADFVPEEGGTPIEGDYTSAPIESNEVNTNIVKQYDVTVKYEDINGNTIHEDNKPYSTLLDAGSAYDVIAQGSKLTEITKDGTTYTFYEVKDGSDAESSDSISKDVVVTYVYVECKAPKIQKKVDTELVKITDPVSTTDYFVTYTLTVTNPNPCAMLNVQCSDTLPDGLEFVQNGSDSRVTAAADNRTLTWTIDSVPANNGTAEVIVKAKITDTAKAPYDNYAVVNSASFNPDNDGNTTTVTYPNEEIKSNTVRTDVYMTPEITKAVDKTLAAIGQEVTYTITVKNNSSVPLYNLTVSDTIPEGMEFVSGDTAADIKVIYNNGKPEGAVGSASAEVSGSAVTAYIPALGRYDTATITLKVTITDGSELIYKNTAYIESGYVDPVPEGTTPPESSIDRTPSNEVETKIDADPYITKTVDKEAAYLNDKLVYTIVVTNNTADTLYDVKVTDVVPAELEYVSASDSGVYDSETETVTWTIPSIAPGDSTVKFTAKLTDNSSDKVTNTAVLEEGYTDTDGDGTKEYHEYGKDDDAVTYIIEDPTIHKAVDKPLTYVGDNIVYTLTVKNNDNVFDLYDIAVTDTLPEGLEFVSASEGIEHSGSVISITVPKLAVGESEEYKITAKIVDGKKAIYYNTAYITEMTADTDKDGDGDEDDRTIEYPNGTNHSNTVVTDVHYDLVIEYRADSPEGDRLKSDYESLDNIRNSEYSVTDLIDETIVDEDGNVWVKKEITDDSDILEGKFDEDKKIVVIYERYDSLYSLKKYVSTDGIDWKDDKITVAPGAKVWYKIVITNNCGHEITDLVLSDVLKMNGAAVDYPDVSAFADACGTTLPVEGWESAPIEYTVPDTAESTDVFVNVATVSNLDEDIPSVSDDAVVEVYRNDSLKITKTAQVAADDEGNKKVMQSENVVFVLMVENDGNTTLRNVQVIDDTYDVTYNGNLVPKGSVITTLDVLSPGDAVPVTVTFAVPESAEDGAAYDNYATAKTVDENGNDVLKSTDNDVVIVSRVEPRLSVVKTVNGEEKYIAKPGETVTFTVTVRNTGNADAENVYVYDHMLVDGAESDENWVFSGGWTVSVSASDSVVVADAIQWTVPLGTPSDTDFTNIALLYDSEKDFTDGKNPIDEDSAEVVTDGVYDIEISKDANVQNVKPGEKITYAVAVTNKGNASLSEISVTDLLNGEWGELPTETENGKAVKVTSDSDNVLCIDSLEPSDVLWLTFTYTVPEDYTESTVMNTVKAEAETPDGDIDSEATEAVNVHVNSLAVTKEAHCEEIYAEEKVYYYITATNTGKTTLENVVVTDNLNVKVLNEYVRVSDGDLSKTDLTADDISASDVSTTDLVIGYAEKLEPGECRVFYVEYEVPADAPVGEKIWNTATAEADGGHKDSASDDVTVIEYVERKYALSITKTTTAELVNNGDNVSYLITVTNTGKDDLTDVVVTDSLDVVYGGVEYKAGTALETIELLRSGESKIVNVSYTVPAGYSGKSIVNTAYADSNETDKVEASATVTLRNPEVKLSKTVNSQNVTAGERVYYKLVVTNTGNCTLTDVLVQDSAVGYSFTIDRIEPGEVWESADGALTYVFDSSASQGTSFRNDANVIHAEVKGSASTQSTVYQSAPIYNGAPNTGDESDGAKGAAIAITLVSGAILIAVGGWMYIRRRKAADK